MKVWIVGDQDSGDQGWTVEKVFLDEDNARRWMAEHEDEAFGHFTMAMGPDFEESFEIEDADSYLAYHPDVTAIVDEAINEHEAGEDW